MHRVGVVVAVLAGAVVTTPGLIREFVIGPGMLGSPADDPMVGYSSVTLDEKLNSPDPNALAIRLKALEAQLAKAGEPVPAWLAHWIQSHDLSRGRWTSRRIRRSIAGGASPGSSCGPSCSPAATGRG